MVKKYFYLVFSAVFISACCGIEETRIEDTKDVYMKIANPDLALYAKDSLEYFGLGSNSKRKAYAYNTGSGASFDFSLSLRYKSDNCSFIIKWHDLTDTVTMAYQREVVKVKKCIGDSYEVKFTAKNISKTSLDTTKVVYNYDSKASKSVNTIYATY